MVNVDNVRATIELIEGKAGPKQQFNMSQWGASLGLAHQNPEDCGTQMCFAGWAVIASGGELRSIQEICQLGEDCCPEPWYGVRFFDADGNSVDPADHAQEWLGLPNGSVFYKTDIKDVGELRVALKELYEVDV